MLTRSREKSNELASLIPEVFQGQNELAKEQQACALAIGDVMLMSVQINRSNWKCHPKNKHTHTQVTNSDSIWMVLDHINHYPHFGLSTKKNILVSTPGGPLRVGKHKGPGSGSTSFSASRSVGQSGRTLGFSVFSWSMVMSKKTEW